jgi:tryptophan synthase beta chain
MKTRKIYLEEKEMPRQWYNILADMPNKPLPPLHPGTRQPLGPDDLLPLFPMELIKQEMSPDRYIPIPDEVADAYTLYRPSPLIRAYNFEKMLDTPAKIYFKYEGGNPAGSHKANTALAQAYYHKMEGGKRIVTETGAGQWGSALSFACSYFGIDLKVYMVKVSYEQKSFRKTIMNTWNAEVIPSPSMTTAAGRSILAQDPNSPGSLGIAISEAVEVAAHDPETKYSLGSVLNHVLMHQTIIGLETLEQFKKTDDFPEIVIGCFGGGSNFGGISFPFLRLNFTAGTNIRCVAVEPASCPKLTRGKFMYDFGDTVGLAPMIAMYTLGHEFIPPAIHAGGLRYHGAGAIISQLLKDGLIEAKAIPQLETFAAAVKFARTEGLVAAPETAHAIAQVIREAEIAKIEGKSRTILFNFSGHGIFDLAAYEQYLSGKLTDFEVTESDIIRYLEPVEAMQ